MSQRDVGPGKGQRKKSKPVNELDILRERVKSLEAAKNKRKQAEEALRETEEQYRSLFENMIEGFAYCRMLYENGKPEDFIYLHVNSAFEKLTGLKDVIGRKVSEVIPGIKESSPELFEIYGRVALTRKPERFETYLEPLRIWLSISVYSPEKEHFVAVFDNITLRKQAEERSRYHAALLANVNDAIVASDAQYRLTAWNAAAESLYGWKEEEVLGRNGLEIMRTEWSAATAEEMRRTIAEAGHWRGEAIQTRKDGTRISVELVSVVLHDESGQITGYVSVNRDITELKRAESQTEAALQASKQAEDALRESEKRFRLLYEQAPLGYQSLDAEGCFIDVNQAWLDLLRYSRDEVIGRWFGDFLAPDEVEPFKQRFQRFKATGEVHVDLEMVQHAGSTIIVHIDGRIGHDGHGQLKQTHCILTDITERKQREEGQAHETRLHKFRSEMAYSVNRELSLREILQQSAETIMRNFDIACAQIWTMNREMNSLELQAHGELSTLCTESGECIHIGNLLAGRVVAKGETIASNSILDRPLLIDASWARHHHIVAYAGLPLFVEDHLVGVLTVFAGTLLLERTLSPLAGSAVTLAQGIMRKRAEEALRREKENFRHSLDESPLGVRIVTADGDTLYANQAILDFYGYDSLEELRKTPLMARYTPESYAEFQKRKEQRQRGDLSTSEYGISIVRENGEVLHLHVHRKEVLWDGAKQFLVMYQDITERKRAEEELQRSEMQYRSLTENSPDLIARFDKQYRHLYVNPTAAKAGRYSPHEYIGKTIAEVGVPEEEARKWEERIRTAFETGQVVDVEDSFETPKGSRNFHTKFVPEFAPDGSIHSVQSIARDITERKLAEEESRRAEESLALLGHTIRSIGECVSVTDTENRVLFVNDAFSRTYGYTPDELIGKPISVVRSPRTQPPTDEVLYSTCQGGWQGEMVNRKKDGTEFPIALSTSIVRNEEGHVLALVGIALDITERKQAEDKLRESEERFRTLVESQGEGIGIVDAQECFVFANPAAETIFGLPRGSLIDRSLIEFVKSEQWEIIEAQTNLRREGKRSVYELGIVRADGETRYLLVTATPRIQDERYSGAFAVFADITERKQAEEEVRKSHQELRALTSHLHQSIEEERTRIAREIHDEIGQLLTASKMGLVALKRTLSEPQGIEKTKLVEEIQSIMAILDTGTAAIRRIIRDLRPEVLDTMGLSESIEWQAREFQRHTGIRTVVQLPRKVVSVNQPRATALFRVCQEALTNVVRHSNASEVKINLSVKGRSVVLEMIDNGKGATIEELNSPTAFGILSIRERIASFSGKAEISGKPGKGTIVHVEMPVE